MTYYSTGCKPCVKVSCPQNVSETPKPVGEAGVCRQRVTNSIAFVTYFIIHKMVFPSVSFHPSSHFVLLAYRLRGSRYRFPALNGSTGLTPCAIIFPPFRGHCVMSSRPLVTVFCTILCRDAPSCRRHKAYGKRQSRAGASVCAEICGDARVCKNVEVSWS